MFNVLLQVLDDGRLTDGQGRTVDFRNTLIILTSNLGAQHLASLPDGALAEEAREPVMQEVRAAFRPEFLNRLDDIMLFDRLQAEQMGAIVDIQMRRVEDLLVQRSMTIMLSDAGRDYLAAKGYDPVYGARPLKRVIQREVQDALAEEILSGRFGDDGRMIVDVVDGVLSLMPAQKELIN